MIHRIPQSFLQDILARTDIVELIQTRIPLTKRGANHLACCPFHHEKTPSFTVSAEKQFYYCFGCSAHGNALGFLIAFDKVEFIDAVTYLAHQLGMEVPQTESYQTSHKTQMFYSLMEEVAHYYQQQLRQSPQAIDYLKSRGLTGQTAKQFAIGYAPKEWEQLNNHFKQDSTIQTALIENGLLIPKGNRSYDRFRHRILFPIRNIRGNTVAFGGRVMEDEQPKYLNSPETPIFHKSNELYGLYEARQHSHELKRIVIVEGYMDVVSLHQYGITCAVATLGTAIHIRHLQKLLRYTNEVIFCFDGDDAGRRAAWKALTISLTTMIDGMQFRFLFLPKNEDPDSWIHKIGKDHFLKQLDQAEALSVVFFRQLQTDIPINSLDNKAAFAKKACRYLHTIPQGLFRELLFKELMSLLNVSAEDIARLETTSSLLPTPVLRPKKQRSQQVLPPAYLAAAILLQQPHLVEQIHDPTTLKTLTAPGIPLLSRLVERLQKDSTLTTGSLLALCEDADDQNKIAELAARPLPIPAEGLMLELEGALKRLDEQQSDHLAQQLIQKAKINQLTPEEKKKLHQLLTNSQNDPI